MPDPSASSSPPPEQPGGQTAPGTATPDSAASPSADQGSGLPSNVAACIACVPLIGGIVFLIVEKKDQFVRFYAMQSFILGAVSAGVCIALKIVVEVFAAIPFVGWLLARVFDLVGMIVGMAMLTAWIVTSLKAFAGKEWEIPYLGKIARHQLASRTTTAP